MRFEDAARELQAGVTPAPIPGFGYYKDPEPDDDELPGGTVNDTERKESMSRPLSRLGETVRARVDLSMDGVVGSSRVRLKVPRGSRGTVVEETPLTVRVRFERKNGVADDWFTREQFSRAFGGAPQVETVRVGDRVRVPGLANLRGRVSSLMGNEAEVQTETGHLLSFRRSELRLESRQEAFGDQIDMLEPSRELFVRNKRDAEGSDPQKMGYKLRLDQDPQYGWSLVGQLGGFWGPKGREWNGAGNYAGEDWIRANYPRASEINFDSESGMFACYAKSREILRDLIRFMDDAMDGAGVPKGEQTTRPRRRGRRQENSEFEALHRRAHEAGMQAGNAVKVTPIIVSNPGSGERWVERDGACGFAWIKFAGNTPFGRWAKKQGIAEPGDPGLEIWVWEFGQSCTRKEAYARAYARVLNDAGIPASAGSRLD